MNEGFIKIFRSLLDWEWYDDLNVKILFIHLLLKANYKKRKWRGIEIDIGENLTSYPLLSKETGLSVMQIRSCIKKLKSTGEITHKTTANYSIIKLNNYNKYNGDNTQTNSLATDKQQSSNSPVTPKEERKKEKKEKNNILSKDNIEQSSSSYEENGEEKFGKKEINQMQDFIKEQVGLCGFIYKPGRYERARIKNLLEVKKIQELLEKFDLNIYEFVQKIIYISSKIDFWAGKITNAETFYKHYDKILNEAIKLKQQKQEEDSARYEVF